MAKVTISRHGEWYDLICACGYTHDCMLRGKKHQVVRFNGMVMCGRPTKEIQKDWDKSIDESKRHFGRLQEGL